MYNYMVQNWVQDTIIAWYKCSSWLKVTGQLCWKLGSCSLQILIMYSVYFKIMESHKSIDFLFTWIKPGSDKELFMSQT